MVYFYSYEIRRIGVGSKKGSGDGTVEVIGRIDSSEKYLKIREEIKEKILKKFDLYSEENDEIIFTAFNPL